MKRLRTGPTNLLRSEICRRELPQKTSWIAEILFLIVDDEI
jgi:hypothetical protein